MQTGGVGTCLGKGRARTEAVFGNGLELGYVFMSVGCSGWCRMKESLRVVRSVCTEARGAGFLCRAEHGAALLSGALLSVSISCIAAADVHSA